MNNIRRDSDGSLDHLLRDALEAPVTSGSRTDCLSAEIAAAFVDDALGSTERTAALAHAAGCTRCQSLLAAVARTSPPAQAASWWRIPTMGWLAPLSAAAVGMIIWAVLPQQATLQPARTAPSLSPATARGTGAVVPEPSASPSTSSASAPIEQRLESAANQDRPGAAAASEAPVTAPLISAQSASTPVAGTPPAGPPATAPATSAQPAYAPAANAPSMAAGPPASKDSAEKAVTTSQAAGSTAAKAAADPPVERAAQAAAPAPKAEAPTTFRALTTARQNGRLALAESVTTSPPVIASPDATSRWRIVAGGGVQRSIDAGATWERQQTGVTVTLTAGASPSPSICWLVGPRGAVVLSTDGRTWRRVAFPELVDLASVRATDERSATVLTSDGRSFVTKDGGLTWMRSSGA